MSHSTYNKLWASAQAKLQDLLSEEQLAQSLPPEPSKTAFSQRLNTFYVRYVRVYRQLEEAYDQMVHVQRRQVVREALDGVMGRILELKRAMAEGDWSEYHYMDDILQDLKLTPSDIELPVPRHFLGDRAGELQERGALLATALGLTVPGVTGAEGADEGPELQDGAGARSLTRDRAVRILQVAERARQGRCRAEFVKKVRRDEAAMRRKSKVKAPEEGSMERSALCIQRMWRGYLQRKRTKADREEELILLGMASVSGQHHSSAASLAAANEERRRQTRKRKEAEYQAACAVAADNLREAELLNMKEEGKEHIRQWIAEFRDATGTLPDYPEEDEGGSALIFAEEVPENKREAMGLPPKAEEAEKAMLAAAAAASNPEEEQGFRMPASKFLKSLEAAHKTYMAVWRNCKHLNSLEQLHNTDLIKEERRKEVEAEARLKVDEHMREELELLKVAMGLDGGGGGGGGKGKGKGKEKKGKKDKDLTSHRTIESLYQELAEEGLLKQADVVKLQDYLGSFCLLGTTLQQAGIEPMPSAADVRQFITLNAVIPLGSQVVNENAPPVKTILLVGPTGVGKRLLVHAICQETGSNLFDLSPLNLAGKYPGKSGLQMMLHMVFKVAKLLQPSVIWIGGAEKMFYKKVPKEEKEADPKRLKKDLPKLLKTVAEDRVLVLGTARDPSSADLKSLCKMYAKVVLLPRPDYASRHLLWGQFIQRAGGEVTKALNLGSLARISDGYTQGQIAQMVQWVLTEDRLQQLPDRPLATAEFAPSLAKLEPVIQQEQELINWFTKTPQGKARSEAAEDNNVAKNGQTAKKK
ncbi:hypothetical protein JZ751_015553 [Albula glossodonta]|uniref:ATPase AAA-type core domain-containing protein n=1 Tax=Albula glossodonta TaxID=121402 RepID=A0A8T2MYB6_9TELE|nr:hypothetical protein JZ751_015553 [Albula glossodonta]